MQTKRNVIRGNKSNQCLRFPVYFLKRHLKMVSLTNNDIKIVSEAFLIFLREFLCNDGTGRLLVHGCKHIPKR